MKFVGNKMKSLVALTMLVMTLNGCSSLSPVGIAEDILMPDSGLTVDTQIGDKELSLGSNIEVDSEQVGKVVGNDEVSNQAQVINQTNVPTSWFLIGTLSFFLMTAIAFIGWMMPVPKWVKGR